MGSNTGSHREESMPLNSREVDVYIGGQKLEGFVEEEPREDLMLEHTNEVSITCKLIEYNKDLNNDIELAFLSWWYPHLFDQLKPQYLVYDC